ncbi:MAG: aspartate aminotransferase family protein [Oscillospiraceae bacterium]|nr:aspartate aminotransferase family protein [Oscillospiraceae bacterium]
MNTIEKFDSHVMGTYGRFGVVMENCSGASAHDENGKTYIDFGSGIGTNSLGFCDDVWADAVCAQVRSVQHTSNYYYTKVQADLADKLCTSLGYDKVFFGNSGAEANECAIKIARKYSFDKYGADAKRYKIVTLVNSFHGRTMATLSATGQDAMHNYFFPFVEGFVNVKANDIDDLREKLADDKICAVMFECVQGEGGVNALEQPFVDEIFRLCAEKDILTICDEVQTGMGRTGKLLASQHFGVKPDVITLAKGIAGGIPMGACLTGEKASGVLTKGMHGSTFGGNPIACAGANAVIDRLTSDGFMDEVTAKGEYFRKKLAEIDEVEAVSGIGMMIGITVKTKKAADICAKCVDKGLLVLTAKDKVRLLPPLTISYEDIDSGMKILAEVMSE